MSHIYNVKTSAAATAAAAKKMDENVLVTRRNDPYGRRLSALPEEVFSRTKNSAQAWAEVDTQYNQMTMDSFIALVHTHQGNDRSLNALQALVTSSPWVEKQLQAYIIDRLYRCELELEASGVRMATKEEILSEQEDLVALTFGQLPLTGLSDKALFVLINTMVPGAAVFVTAAAHAKMRSHGLRFVLVRKALADTVKDLMHHRLLFSTDSVCVLSVWAATLNGFKGLAGLLSIRDMYLRQAVASIAGDTQSKLTGGAWPATVQDCKKSLASLSDFAEAMHH